MIRERPPAPMVGRVDVRLPVSPALVAAVAGTDVEVASRCLDVWCDAVPTRCLAGDVVLFDGLVVGPNEPILLEGWHAVRCAARDQAQGLFGELEASWYDTHADGCGDQCEHVIEEPSVTEWALFGLRRGWCGDRFVDGRHLVAGRVDVDTSRIIDVVRAEIAIERLVVELADAITIGGLPVIDARLPAHRRGGLRLAA